MVITTGLTTLLRVINLALKGFGAPFAITVSKKLVVGWFYTWTRNSMTLAALAIFLTLGIWF